jgi:hypothetical protein
MFLNLLSIHFFSHTFLKKFKSNYKLTDLFLLILKRELNESKFYKNPFFYLIFKMLAKNLKRPIHIIRTNFK